jgi:hypothetical protein
MTSEFKVQRLTNHRAVVRGTDSNGTEGETVLDTYQWDTEIVAHDQFVTATASFDKAVEEFFSPLTEAGEKISQALARTEDPIAFYVREEGTPGVPGKPADIVRLNKDSVVLRLIENNETERLVWVNEELEVLEVLPTDDEAAALVAEVLGGVEVEGGRQVPLV